MILSQMRFNGVVFHCARKPVQELLCGINALHPHFESFTEIAQTFNRQLNSCAVKARAQAGMQLRMYLRANRRLLKGQNTLAQPGH